MGESKLLLGLLLIAMNLAVGGCLVWGHKRFSIYVIRGRIAVVRGGERTVDETTLTEPTGKVYRLACDANGRRLGLEMEGKTVEVTGRMRRETGEKRLVVERCSIVESSAGDSSRLRAA